VGKARGFGAGFGASVSFTPRSEKSIFAELLIDCEEDRTLRPVLVGVLREAGRTFRRCLMSGREVERS
jgi:hypothetical protein